jgi:hypothetical protein
VTADPRNVFQTAEVFRAGSIVLGNLINQGMPHYMFPMVICSAFSLELHLKALILIEGKIPEKHHDLEKLFAQATPESQQAIRGSYEPRRPKVDARFGAVPGIPRPNSAFDFVLHASSKAFEHFRYAYEGRVESGEGWLADPMRDCVRERNIQLQPDWATLTYGFNGPLLPPGFWLPLAARTCFSYCTGPMAYTLGRFEAELKRALDARREKAEADRRQEVALEKKIGNLTAALADGFRSPAVLSELARVEAELAEIRRAATVSNPEAVNRRVHDTRRFVESRLKDLQALFGTEAAIVRAEIVKHVQRITLTPEGRTYVASGTWDVLGAWQHGWCRGPESNWLRPPFQGGALPMSYPG